MNGELHTPSVEPLHPSVERKAPLKTGEATNRQQRKEAGKAARNLIGKTFQDLVEEEGGTA